MWNNSLENRTGPFYSFETQDAYTDAAESLSNRLLDLLDPPYTSEPDIQDKEVSAKVRLTPSGNKRPYSYIDVGYMTKPKDQQGAPFLKLEMRKKLRTYDLLDEVTIHYIDSHYIIVGASYNVTKDGSGFFARQNTSLNTEIPPEYLNGLEQLIGTYSRSEQTASADS